MSLTHRTSVNFFVSPVHGLIDAFLEMSLDDLAAVKTLSSSKYEPTHERTMPSSESLNAQPVIVRPIYTKVHTQNEQL